MADSATRALGAEMDRQKTALKTVAAQTQRIHVAVQEHAARVGLRLPPTEDPRRLEAQSKLVALLGRREPTTSADAAAAR